MLQISIDTLWILRTSAGLLWGIVYALFLQLSRSGRQLASDLTWLAVVIGVGIDLLVSFNSDYFNVSSVICSSSLGIIIRSLYNESRGQNHPYKATAAIEDAIAKTAKIIEIIRGGLKSDKPAAVMSVSLELLDELRCQLKEARQFVCAPSVTTMKKIKVS